MASSLVVGGGGDGAIGVVAGMARDLGAGLKAGGLSVAERQAVSAVGEGVAGADRFGHVRRRYFFLGSGRAQAFSLAPLGVLVCGADAGGAGRSRWWFCADGLSGSPGMRRPSAFSPGASPLGPDGVWVLREGNHRWRMGRPCREDQTTGLGPLGIAGWRRVLNQRPTDRALLSVDTTAISFGKLSAVRRELSDLLTFGVEPESRYEGRAHADLKAAIDDYKKLGHVIKRIPGLLQLRRSDLVTDFSNTVARIAHLKAEIVTVENVIAQVDALIKDCAAPSPDRPLHVPRGQPRSSSCKLTLVCVRR